MNLFYFIDIFEKSVLKKNRGYNRRTVILITRKIPYSSMKSYYKNIPNSYRPLIFFNFEKEI